MSQIMRIGKKSLTKREKWEQTQAYFNMCLAVLEEQHTTREGIANATGLSVSTIRRLGLGQFTLAVRWSTILAVGEACGLALSRTKTKYTVTLMN